MFPDNLGWGEVNVYGGVRGAITPRLDRLAAEGLRLNNFNVEFSCTIDRESAEKAIGFMERSVRDHR